MTQRISYRLWPLLILLLAAFLRLYRLASVPFGWHPDEATKALLARDVLAGKFFPAFFSAFTGRDALFVYLEAGLFSLIGEHIFGGRLLSAFVGILTVAATYAIGKLLFNRRIASLAAAFLAVSLWHLIASRNGYRAVIQPLIQLPVIWFLLRGFQSDGLQKNPNKLEPKLNPYPRSAAPYFLIGGFFLGLTQYTYTAVRVFPFLIIAIVLLGLLYRPRLIWQHRLNLFLMALVALLVLLPLGLHFWQNPTDIYGRAAQISVFSSEWSGGDPWVRLWQSVKETGRMWTQWGDINFRFNIKGQPVFGPIAGTLFYFGLLLCLWRVIRPDRFPPGRTRLKPDERERILSTTSFIKPVRSGMLLLWILIMLVPMMLSAESLPYYQRAIGVLPAIYFFPAIALDWLFREWGIAVRGPVLSLPKYWKLPSISKFQAPIFLLLFGWLILQLYNDYFDQWHEDEQNDDDRRVAMVYVADYLREHAQNSPLYLSTQYMQHPTLALLAPQIYDGIHWFDARQSLPLPPEGSRAGYLLLAENAPQPQLLKRVEDLVPIHIENDRFERPVFTMFTWQKGAVPTPADQSPPVWSWETSFEAEQAPDLRHWLSLPVNFGDVLRFVGHDRNTAVSLPGDTIELVLHWQTISKPDRQYTFFAHVLNVAGQVVAGFDANDYPTSFWNPDGGEYLLSYFPLTIPADVQPGTYQIEIGVYNQPSGERLPVLDGNEAVADRLLLAPLEVR